MIAIIIWAAISVIVDLCLTTTFALQLQRIYKASKGEYNRLTAILWLLVISCGCHIPSVTLMATVYIINDPSNPDQSTQVPTVILAFQAIFLGIYFTALFMSQFLFSFKYWEISFEFPRLLGAEVEQVSSKVLKSIEIFFMLACVVLPITVAFLRFVYIKNALDPNNS